MARSYRIARSADHIGSLDELAIYDKPLDPARVLAHYQAAGR